MKSHGNSLKNDKLHHLYAIMDKETELVDKYGISHDPIESDGLSARLRDQIDLFNRIAGWLRFFGIILRRDIPGRPDARKIETAHIRAFRKKHGQNPPGNLRD